MTQVQKLSFKQYKLHHKRHDLNPVGGTLCTEVSGNAPTL